MAAASPSQVAMQEALKAFSIGEIERASSVLDAAAQEEKSRADISDALSLACMRASLAAMEGAADVTALMAPVAGTVEGAVATLYVEGLAALAKNTPQTARVKFDEALRKDAHFKLANLGLAVVYYQLKNYKASFSQYREALSSLGSVASPAIVRVGMGLCAYHLGRLTQAKQFLERALQVNPEDELALFGLVVVYVDQRMMAKVAEVVSKLRARLPHNAMVLLKVCDLMYFKALGSQRLKPSLRHIQHLLAEVRRLGNADECALADYQEGRLLLVSGDLAGAQPLLEAALRTLPTLLAARIHYARLLHYSGKETEAIGLLKTIDKEHPNQKEVLQLLALHATRHGRHEAALRYCRLLTDTVAQGDLRSWSLAAWCARLNPQENVQLIDHVVNIRRDLGLATSWQLLANTATIHGDLAALQAVVDRELGGDFTKRATLSVEHVPLVFNLARLLEAQDAARARQLYVFLVKRHATFTLPYLRLHEMAKREGKMQQAVAWLTLLTEVWPEEASAHAAIARSYFDAKRPGVARAVLRSANSKAVPVVLAEAATRLWYCMHARDDAAMEQLTSAKKRYCYVLSTDKNNILAAHGLACCLALERQGDQAQSLLSSVSEVKPNSPCAHDNLDVHMANVKMLSERYKQAVDYLLKVKARTPAQNSLLALCYACDGRFQEAIDTLTVAIARADAADERSSISKADLDKRRRMLKYNLCLVCCSAFLHGVSSRRPISVERGRELNKVLELGLGAGREFLDIETTSSVWRDSRRNVKSLCSYTLSVHGTIFKQLVVAGVKGKAEQEREAGRWRAVAAEFAADKERDAKEKELDAERREEERRERGERLLQEFRERQLENPIEYADPEIRAARTMDFLAAESGDLMEADGNDGAAGEEGAAQSGSDDGNDYGDFAVNMAGFAG